MIAGVELIDVLDATGAPAGRTKPKPEIHRDGDWHRAVHVWILTPDGGILVQRRALVKENNPGLWDVSCAGHISAGESVINACVRESKEELGLDIEPHEFRHVGTFAETSVLNGGTYIDNEFHEIFVVHRDIDVSKLRLQAEEVGDARLVTREELRELDMVEHPREYEMLFGL